MTANEIMAELKHIAPNVVFSVNAEADHNFRWDGDGPDPEEDGFQACDIEVKASTIVNGEMIDESACMGGSYHKPGEPLDDLGGYLPQMLEDAAMQLRKTLENKGLKGRPGDAYDQLASVLTFLKKEMRARYNAQRAETERAKP